MNKTKLSGTTKKKQDKSNNGSTAADTYTHTHNYTKSYRDLSGCVGIGSRSIA